MICIRKRWFGTSCLAAGLMAVLGVMLLTAVSATALDRYPPQRAVLPNGLRIIAVEDRSLPMVSAVLLQNMGGDAVFGPLQPCQQVWRAMIVNSDTQAGPRTKLDQRVEALGLLTETAFSTGVSADRITLSCEGPAENLETVLEYLCEVGFRLRPTQKDLDEARQRLQRRQQERVAYPLASGWLHEKAEELLVMGKGPAGQEADYGRRLGAVTLDDLLRFQRERLVSNNAVLVVVGAVSPSDVFKLGMKQFGELKATPETCPITPPPIASQSTFEDREFLDIKNSQVVVSFEAPGYADPDMFAATILQAHLGDAHDSWIERTLSREFPTLKRIRSIYRPKDGRGMLSISFETDDSQVNKPIEAILKYLATVPQTPPTGEELQRLISSSRSMLSLTLEKRSFQAFGLGYAESVKDFAIAAGAEKSLEQVSTDDVRRVAKRLFENPRYAIKIVQPHKAKECCESLVEVKTLENGFRVLSKTYSGSEVAGFALEFSMPLNLRSLGRHGAPELLRALIETTIADPLIARKLDQIGGHLMVKSQFDALVVMGYVEKRRIGDLLDIMRHVAFDTDWSVAQFDEARRNVEQKRSDMLANPSSQLMQGFLEKAFADIHLGDTFTPPESLASLTLDVVREFRSKWVVPGNALVSVVANLEGAAIQGECKRAFGALAKAEPPTKPGAGAKIAPPSAISEAEIKIDGMPDRAVVMVGFRLPPFAQLMASNENRHQIAANMVLLHLLTWSQNGLLTRAFKERGLAQAMETTYKSGSEYSFYATTIPVMLDKVQEAKDLVKQTLAKVTSSEITDEQVNTARRVVASFFMSGMEMSLAQATYLTGFMRVGVGGDFITELNEQFKKLTPSQVRQVAETWFKNPVILIGKP